jgi:hypothetical protein
MKYLFILIASIAVAFNTYSQVGYQSGVIVMQNNDTLFCLVPLMTTFGNEVPIKKKEHYPVEYIKLKNIKYLANGFTVYENVGYMNKAGKEIHKLMLIQVDDDMSLFSETLVQSVREKEGFISVSGMLDAQRTYVIGKGNQTFLIEEKSFIDDIINLISDVPALADKVKNKKATYKQIDLIVKEYNRLAKNDTITGSFLIDTVTHMPKPTFVLSGSDTVYNNLQNEASFPGGHDAWTQYILKVLAKKALSIDGAENTGNCIVKFIVDKSGTVQSIEATTMQGTHLAKVAVDAIRKGPKWIPGTLNGIPVSSYKLQPISYMGLHH